MISVSDSSGADSVPLVSTAASAPAANSSESPGQERRDHEAGLGEHDGEEDQVDPETVVAQQLDEVRIEMQDDVDEPVEELGIQLISSMRASFPRRGARARGHAGAAALGLCPLSSSSAAWIPASRAPSVWRTRGSSRSSGTPSMFSKA